MLYICEKVVTSVHFHCEIYLYKKVILSFLTETCMQVKEPSELE